MRNLIVFSLALSTLSSTAAVACGDPPLHVLRIDTFHAMPEAHVAPRSFVVLDTHVADTDRTWTRLPTDMYISPEIADATTLAYPVTLTLVGPHGARVIQADKQVVYRDGMSKDAHLALEVPASDEAVIAIAGRRPDAGSAMWHGFDYTSNRGAAGWLARHGIRIQAGSEPQVLNVTGTYLQVIWYTAAAGDAAALIKLGNTVVATGAERAFGVLEVGGVRYLVSKQDDGRTIAVPLTR